MTQPYPRVGPVPQFSYTLVSRVKNLAYVDWIELLRSVEAERLLFKRARSVEPKRQSSRVVSSRSDREERAVMSGRKPCSPTHHRQFCFARQLLLSTFLTQAPYQSHFPWASQGFPCKFNNFIVTMPAKKTKKTHRQETRHCTAKTVDEPPHEKSQGICAFDVETEGPPDMINSAKSEMNGIIHRQEITVEPSNEGVRVGNSAGLAVGRQLDQMNSNMARVLSRNEQMETQNRQLEERVAFLEATSHDFSSARSRYLSFAKRDVFGTSNEDDERIIKAGNRIVHSGNARADAGLYDRNVRRDFTTYIRLYGVHPGTVNAIGKFKVFPCKAI